MIDDSDSNDSIKVILLGESGVGKTNLIGVSQGKPFNPNSVSSMGSSYSQATIKYKDKEYQYVLWDTAGQESYRSLNKLFMYNAKVIIFVYSIDNPYSFKELNYWIETAENEVEGHCIKGIVGNKNDLYDMQKVKDEEAEEFAEKLGMKIKFTSALSDPNGFKSFLNELIVDYINKDSGDNGQKNINKKNINLNNKKRKKKWC